MMLFSVAKSTSTFVSYVFRSRRTKPTKCAILEVVIEMETSAKEKRMGREVQESVPGHLQTLIKDGIVADLISKREKTNSRGINGFSQNCSVFLSHIWDQNLFLSDSKYTHLPQGNSSLHYLGLSAPPTFFGLKINSEIPNDAYLKS